MQPIVFEFSLSKWELWISWSISTSGSGLTNHLWTLTFGEKCQLGLMNMKKMKTEFIVESLFPTHGFPLPSKL